MADKLQFGQASVRARSPATRGLLALIFRLGLILPPCRLGDNWMDLAFEV